MKQLLILSGKGGTGKTTIASAFIKLSQARAYADCDVDAPNLHLITKYRSEAHEYDYYGMPKADINLELCVKCNQCIEKCRFNAILPEYKVDPFGCEGCGVCEFVCPVSAITLKPAVPGKIKLYANEKVFSTAQLEMGSGNTGKLVTEVKQNMRSAASDAEFAIIDGSPGTGCPVIASLSGVDLVLIVTEPSISGISDMERIIDTAKKFGLQIAVCINKYDANIYNTKKIEEYCKEEGLTYVGRIPYDPLAVEAINNGYTIVDIDSNSGNAVRTIFNKVMHLLFE